MREKTIWRGEKPADKGCGHGNCGNETERGVKMTPNRREKLAGKVNRIDAE